MKATYHYKVTNFQGGYIDLSTRVEVIGETGKSYRVKFLQFGPNGHRPGDTATVRKKNIQFDGQPRVLVPKTANYRLPYADN